MCACVCVYACVQQDLEFVSLLNFVLTCRQYYTCMQFCHRTLLKLPGDIEDDNDGSGIM